MRIIRSITQVFAITAGLVVALASAAGVSLASLALSASYAPSGQPTSFVSGTTSTYSVRVTNTGTATWSAGGTNPVHLGIHFAQSGGGIVLDYGQIVTDRRVALPYNVGPGGSVVLSVTVTPPSTLGTYVLEYQMVEENVAWFTQYLDSTVSVKAAALNASYAPSGQPGTFTTGASSTYSVKVTNNGTATWQAGTSNPVHLGIHFATAGGGYPANAGTWTTDQRFSLPTNIGPGGSATLTVTVTAPGNPGTYVLEYQMIDENVAVFPQYLDSRVTVNAPPSTSPPSSGSCTGASTQTACIQAMLNIINGDRAAAGLAPYSLNMTDSNGTSTCPGAYGHSTAMAQTGSIWHVNSSYPQASFPNNICMAYSAAGQNVGMASGSEVSALQTIDNLMMSEPHDASTCATTVNHACNILSKNYHQVGIGIYYVNNVAWLTEDFAN